MTAGLDTLCADHVGARLDRRSCLTHGSDLPVDQRSTPMRDVDQARPRIAPEEVDDPRARCGIRDGALVDVVVQEAHREHALGTLAHTVEVATPGLRASRREC